MSAIEIKILQAGPVTWEIQYANQTSVTSAEDSKPIFCFDNAGRDIFFSNINHGSPSSAYTDVLVNGQEYCVRNFSNQPATADIFNEDGGSLQQIVFAARRIQFLCSEPNN